MSRKKTKKVRCWEDLVSWIESLNPYENTVVLTGWINRIDEDGTLKIDSLVFHRVSTDMLLDVHQDKYNPDRRKNKDEDKLEKTKRKKSSKSSGRKSS